MCVKRTSAMVYHMFILVRCISTLLFVMFLGCRLAILLKNVVSRK